MKHVIVIFLYMASAYILNKYGLNIIDQPFDFIILTTLMSVAPVILSMDL